MQGLSAGIALIVLTVFFVLFCVFLCMALSRSEGLEASEREGGFSDWWKWINQGDPSVRSRPSEDGPSSWLWWLSPTPPAYRQVTDDELRSWQCPVCGSMIPSQDVRRLEEGYDVECRYCGATVSPK